MYEDYLSITWTLTIRYWKIQVTFSTSGFNIADARPKLDILWMNTGCPVSVEGKKLLWRFLGILFIFSIYTIYFLMGIILIYTFICEPNFVKVCELYFIGQQMWNDRNRTKCVSLEILKNALFVVCFMQHWFIPKMILYLKRVASKIIPNNWRCIFLQKK